MHKHLLAAVLSLAVAMTGASALEAHAKTTFVTIGTGGITGVYYTTGGVNLRSGPGTSYDKVTTVSLGSEVQAAAKQDGWTFVSVDGKFGWINSDFLSTTRPAS